MFTVNNIGPIMYKRLLIVSLMAVAISFLLVTPIFAAEYGGIITNLAPDKASYPNPGETITITCQGTFTNAQGHGKTLDDSQIVYTITDGGGNVVGTHTATLDPLEVGDSFTDTWVTTNTNFPTEGSYTITAKWYDGTNHNPGHLITSSSTSFTSIPSPWIIVVIAGITMTIAAFARKRRWWLSYYLVGSVSVVALLMSFFVLTGYDSYIMSIEAQSMAYVASILGMSSQYLAPNAFLFPDPAGWSIFGIGLECSSIIEISVFVALLLFYPSYSWKTKLKYATIGVVATYLANIIRILSIVAIVAVFGKTSVYLAHAIIGKLIFFVLIVILYWYLLTKPTMNTVRKNIKSGKF